MLPDLHCHSTASDGVLEPQALVDAAALAGVTLLAITDHDTTVAYDRIHVVPPGLQLIPGIEFSTLWRNRGVHVVGLGFERQHPVIQQAVAAQARRREERAVQIGAVLSKKGFPGSLEGASRLAGGENVGRPHFARYLVDIGAVRTVSDAFRKYLGDGKPGDVKQLWPDMEEAVDWVLAAGGVPVLAHPAKYELTRTRLSALLDAFVASGGKAMEVCSGLQVPSVTNNLAELCQRHGLLASCGSDFHQPGQPWAALGRYTRLPESCEPVWTLWQGCA